MPYVLNFLYNHYLNSFCYLHKFYEEFDKDFHIHANKKEKQCDNNIENVLNILPAIHLKILYLKVLLSNTEIIKNQILIDKKAKKFVGFMNLLNSFSIISFSNVLIKISR